MSLIQGDSILTDARACADGDDNYSQMRIEAERAAKAKEAKENMEVQASKIKATTESSSLLFLLSNSKRKLCETAEPCKAGSKKGNGNMRG